MFQRSPIEAATHFYPVTASHLNHQNALPGLIPIASRPNYFHRNHSAASRYLPLVRSTTILIQRSYSKITFLTERFPRQPARFILRNQRRCL